MQQIEWMPNLNVGNLSALDPNGKSRVGVRKNTKQDRCTGKGKGDLKF